MFSKFKKKYSFVDLNINIFDIYVLVMKAVIAESHHKGNFRPHLKIVRNFTRLR